MSDNLSTWLMSTPVHLLRYLRQELLGETSSGLGCGGKKTYWVKLREDELCTEALLFLRYCYWAYVGLNQKPNCSSRTECWFQFPPLKGSWGMAIKISHFLTISAWSAAAPLLAVSACCHEGGCPFNAKETNLYIFVTYTFIGIMIEDVRNVCSDY